MLFSAHYSFSIYNWKTAYKIILKTPTNITSDIGTLQSKLVTSSGATVEDDISTLQSKLVTSPGATVEDDIGRLQGKLVASPGATVEADIETVRNNIDDSVLSSRKVGECFGAPSNFYFGMSYIWPAYK